MPLNGIDPAAKQPARIRRNWARTSKGAVATTFSTVQPVSIDAQDRFVLNVASNGGIDDSVGALKIKLDTGSGLAVGSGGLKIAAGGVTGAMLLSGLTLPPFAMSVSANKAMGTVGLTAGVAVVSNTSVTANTRVFLTQVTPGGTVGFWDTATRTPGTSFTITSTSILDTSIVAYLLIEPV